MKNQKKKEIESIKVGELTTPTIRMKRYIINLTHFLYRYKDPFLRLINHKNYDEKGNFKLGFRLKLGWNFLNSPSDLLTNGECIWIGNKKIKIHNNKFFYNEVAGHVIHFANNCIVLINIPLLEGNIEKVVESRYIAYILGCIISEGDQHIELKFKRSKYEIVYVTEFYNNNKKILKAFKNAFSKVYSKRLNEYSYNSNTCLKCFSKDAFEDVRKYIGNKSSHCWSLPKFVNNTVAAWFLRGFIDGEGSARYNEKQRGYYLRFHSVNKEGLLQIQKLLNNLHIHSRFHSEKDNTLFAVTITGYENLKRFLKIIGTERNKIKTKICKYFRLMEKRYPIMKDTAFVNQKEEKKWLRELVKKHGYFEANASRYRLECRNIKILLKTMRIVNKIGKEHGFSCYALTKSKRPRLVISKENFVNFLDFLN